MAAHRVGIVGLTPVVCGFCKREGAAVGVIAALGGGDASSVPLSPSRRRLIVNVQASATRAQQARQHVLAGKQVQRKPAAVGIVGVEVTLLLLAEQRHMNAASTTRLPTCLNSTASSVH